MENGNNCFIPFGNLTRTPYDLNANMLIGTPMKKDPMKSK